MGSLSIKTGGVWKTINNVKAKYNGSWVQVKQVYAKMNGVWKPVWSYAVPASDSFSVDWATTDSNVTKTYSVVAGTTATVTISYDLLASSHISFTGATILSKNAVTDSSKFSCIQLYAETSTSLDYWRCSECGEAVAAGSVVTIQIQITDSTLSLYYQGRHCRATVAISYQTPGS